jgi:hypothetical protein
MLKESEIRPNELMKGQAERHALDVAQTQLCDCRLPSLCIRK